MYSLPGDIPSESRRRPLTLSVESTRKSALPVRALVVEHRTRKFARLIIDESFQILDVCAGVGPGWNWFSFRLRAGNGQRFTRSEHYHHWSGRLDRSHRFR